MGIGWTRIRSVGTSVSAGTRVATVGSRGIAPGIGDDGVVTTRQGEKEQRKTGDGSSGLHPSIVRASALDLKPNEPCPPVSSPRHSPR